MSTREPANVTLRLRQLELHGSGPRARSLKALPAHFVQGIDHSNQGVRPSLARPSMGSLLREMEILVVRADSTWMQNRRAMTQIRTLMSTLCARVSESVQQREVFVSCQGDVLVVHLLHTLAAGEGGPPTDMAVAIINECVQLTAELAIADLQVAEAFATQRPLVAALFALMGDRRTVDAALTLAQELLSVGADVFPLSAVPNFSELIRGLSPRGLSLMGRALAVLLAKTAEQNQDGVPAPECVPPELCASCANNAVLLALPQLLERIVRLLQTEAPPAGLWDHMLTASQLPNVLLAGWPGDELGWDQLGDPAIPRVITVLVPQHALPQLAAAAGDEAELMAAVSMVGATLPGLDLPGFELQTGPNGETHGSLHLASLQSSLWSTLQADLLYVLWALMGGKTKQEAQRQAVDMGLLPVVRAMLDRLDWKARATHHHGQHGAGCSCSPQSCLQMQLLRTLQAICEKESEGVSYHRLLLLTDQTEPTLAGDVAGGPDAARPGTDAGVDEPEVGGGGGDSSSREIWSSSELARAERRDAHAREAGGVPAAGGSARGSSSAGAGPSSPPPQQQQSPLARAAAAMPTPAHAPPGSVLYRLLALLLEQSSTSVYLLGLASCIHKWVQASAPHEQLLVAAHPGLLDFLLDQILTPEPPAEPQLQVFFDLLAELIKFNPVLLDRVQTELTGGASSGAPHRPPRAALFLERLLEYTVDASILVQGVALTLAPHASPLRGARALAALNLAPPDPFCAAAAGMPPASAGSGGLARADGPLGRAARGCIAEFLQARRVRLARSLMSAVQLADVSVETMCVINAAIIFFLLADLEGQTQGLLDDICNYAEEEEEEAQPLGGAAPGPLTPGARAMLANFAQLLGFWAEVYHSLSCERKFLEFSSGVPFPKWQALVRSLQAAIQLKLAVGGEDGGRSGTPRAAEAAEAPAPRECPGAGMCDAGCACDAFFGLSLGRVGLCA